MAIDLHHRDLPKLEAAGLVEYDARSRTVRYDDHPALEAYLDVVDGEDARTGDSGREE